MVSPNVFNEGYVHHHSCVEYNVEEQLYSELLPNSIAYQPNPKDESSHLYSQPHSFCHYPLLMIILGV